MVAQFTTAENYVYLFQFLFLDASSGLAALYSVVLFKFAAALSTAGVSGVLYSGVYRSLIGGKIQFRQLCSLNFLYREVGLFCYYCPAEISVC
mgnify:FL=1